MNLHDKNGTAVEDRRLAEDLLEASLVDTVYGDRICSGLATFWNRP